MRDSVRRFLSVLGIVTLACSSGELTAPEPLVGNGNTSTTTPASVVITPPASSDLFVGQSIALVAAVKNAAGVDITTVPVVWSTSDASIATVTSTGTLTGVKVGTVTITGTASGKSASVTINVRLIPVKSVTVTVKPSLVVGEVSAAAAVPVDAQGATLTGRVVAWSSRDPGVASVSTTGQVTAVAVGTATIDAVIDGVIGSATVTVLPLPIVIGSITVSLGQTSASTPGQTTTASAVVKSTLGGVLTDRIIQWTSANTDVATVSQLGVVTAIASGTTVITASSEGKSGSAAFTVNIVLNLPVASLVISTVQTTLSLGKTSQSTAVVRDANGTILTGRTVGWSSSNAAVATVSGSGLIQGTGLGTATITAQSETKTATLIITVIPPPVTNVVVSAPSTNLQPTQTTQAVAVLKDVDGNILSGRIIVWTSGTPATATVSASGLVTALASGTTLLTATSEGISASITITVPAVATVSVAAAANFVIVGATAQLTATPKDASNNALANRVTTWSSGTPAVATVSATGLVTAITIGTSTISATSETKVGTFLFSVVPPVGSIAVNASTNALLLNGQSQVTALILDTFGNPVNSVLPVWTSSDPTRATVTQSGVVTQVLGGPRTTVTISASAGGVTTGTQIVLTGHALEVVPTLPQLLNTAAPAAPDIGGVVISVAGGGSLQTALDNALPGDVIELAAGASFTGNFLLRNKGATTKWITIRPSNFASLPPEGQRMTPTIAAALNLPVVQSSNTNNTIGFEASANHYRLIGLNVTTSNVTNIAGQPNNYALINTESPLPPTQVSQIPSNIVIDRMFVHGSATQSVRRCVALNSAASAVIDSHLGECHERGSDSQAIASWNGPGPFKIVNNYLEGAGENIIFGGNDPSIANLIPSDIEIRHNHFFKQPSWRGLWSIKNLLEFKNAQRVLIEGNILENSWTDGQNGLGVGFKSSNQNGGCTWCVTQDVTYRLNILRNVGAAYNLGASPDNAFQTTHARRITIINNFATNINTSAAFDGDGRAFLMDGDLRDIVIAHNTTMTESRALVFGGQPSVSFTARDNVFGSVSYAVLGTGLLGGAAFAQFAPTGYLIANVFIAEPSLAASNFGTLTGVGGYPLTNFFENGYLSPAVAFANSGGGNFALLGSSVYKNKGTDGADIGADIAAINAATTGAIVP